MESHIKFKCNVLDLPISQNDIVRILPNWETCITKVVKDPQSGNLTIHFLICAKTKEEIQEWVDAFQEKSMCTYRIKSTDSATGRYVVFKQRLYCHHKTKCERVYDPSVKNKTRNTNCPSTIRITLRAIKKRYKGANINLKPDPKMPCVIELVASHNHTINSADALRFRPVGNETKEKLIALFKNGHTPASALEDIKLEIYLKHPDNFENILADRKYTPDYGYCHRLYTKEFEKQYGPMDFNNSKKKLLENIKAFNEQSKENCVEVFFSESQYVICICPPLMKRVHRLVKASSEIVFMDSTGTLDHIGSRVFVLLTHSECGALPLAVIVTSSESSDECLSKGFQMLKDLVGTDLFGGSVNGPTLFLTDDSASEQTAIKCVWTNSDCLLCIFHVLQSLWRWLMKSKNGIKQEDQHRLFQDFRAIMYANSVAECEDNYKKAVSNAANYPSYLTYLDTYYWKRKELWALCYRGNKLTRGHNSNNFSEAIMRVLKDKIFERVKANNVAHLVDFILTKFIRYFEMRLLDVAHHRYKKNMFGQLIKIPPPGLIEKIQILTDKIHLVPSEETTGLFYIVNTEVLLCTCIAGRTGKMCKHLHWICFLVQSEEYNEAIDNVKMREMMYFIATGTNANAGWLAPLFGTTVDNNNNNSNSISLEAGPSSKTNDKENSTHVEFHDFINKDEILNEVKGILSNITNSIYNHANESPLELRDSLKIMETKLNNLKTPSAVSSACANFSAEFLMKRKNKNNRILVQPTAVSRRKTNICSRSSHSGGRPRNNNLDLNSKSKTLVKKKARYISHRVKEKYKTVLSDLSTL